MAERRGWTRCLALLALLLAAAGSCAAAEIRWYTFNLPPLYISAGALKGEGVIDQALLKQLIPALSEYQHHVEEVPLKRLELNLRQEAHACALGLLKNAERERELLFSEPFLVQLPPGVLVRRDAYEQFRPYLNAQGRLNLGRLMAEAEFTLGIAAGRSYGAAVDALLLPYRGQKQLFVSSAAQPTRSMLQMTKLGRLDLVASLPYEAAYLQAAEAEDSAGLRFLPLQEQPELIVGYAACAQGAAGTAAIRRINEVLARAEVREAIAAYYERWLDGEARLLARAAYRKGTAWR
ncbi:TIGR02285 family protein [Paucibacter soli]|uniref:TIGR02285 family protein n=1 Tax=Paucibacter soli TaxID=3133433 RepID=UPI0030B4DDE3